MCIYIWKALGATIASRRAALSVSPSQRLSACKEKIPDYNITYVYIYICIYAYIYTYINVYMYICIHRRYHCVAKGGAKRGTKPALERLRGGRMEFQNLLKYMDMYMYV